MPLARIPFLAAISTAFLSAHATAAPAPDAWMLMARHGECAPVSALSRTFPDLGAVTGPDAFVSFVRAKGLTVSARPVPMAAGTAQEVLVPQKELSLLFVKAEVCGRMGTR